MPPLDATAGPAEVTAAARAGRLDEVVGWLRAGGNPNQYDGEGWSPLLAAAVRGRAQVVDALLANPGLPAFADMVFPPSGALPIHFAGHAGDPATAAALLARRPDHLDAVWELNGHTLLLQAVFYGHLELTTFALQRGADTAATTVRGLAAMELARQFQNQALIEAIRPHDRPREEKEQYHRRLLQRIAPVVSAREAAVRERGDALCAAVEAALTAGSLDEAGWRKLRELAEGTDVNRLGGPLQQPPLVVAVTGNDGFPPRAGLAELRLRIADFLLERGADPTVCERHPMAVNAVIRAAVFNHLTVLRRMAERMPADRLAAALNERPAVNGLTALHDSVLRASTAAADRLPGYLEQIRWCVAHGARSDIEDFSGRTQRRIAEGAADPAVRRALLQALGL